MDTVYVDYSIQHHSLIAKMFIWFCSWYPCFFWSFWAWVHLC